MATSTLPIPVVKEDERLFCGFVKKGWIDTLSVLEADTAVADTAAVTGKGADCRVVFGEMKQ